MKVTKQYLQQVIKEEVDLMIQEGELDEALSDIFKNAGRKLAGKAAQMTGLSSDELANQEKDAAAAKVTKQKEIAKKQVLQKVQQASQMVLKIHDEVEQIGKLAAPLSYSSGEKLDVKALGNAAEALMQALDKVEQDVTGERGHVKGASLGIRPSLKEKKVVKK